MWNDRIKQHFAGALDEIRQAGLYKSERTICSPQRSLIELPGDQNVINLCANNYLGLSDHPEIIAAAKQGLDDFGYGLSSVRFICGTQSQHQQLESKLSEFLGMEDTILYSSCFDANGGLFETLLGPEDAIFSDELNHASIIDGIRLCKAKRYRYRNNDIDDLRAKLSEASDARLKLIATDGVFSMDGLIADLPAVCDLADEFDAMVMVDDSHAVGFMGERGRGTHEHLDVMERIDIITGTLGKALGGASGGYTSGKTEVVELLRQRSRPYLFSNSLAPPIVAGSLKTLELIQQSGDLRQKLVSNTQFFRQRLAKLDFDVIPGEHPIVPIMFYDAPLAVNFAEKLLERGIYVIPFSYPVVPKEKARIRTQISAGHSQEELEFALEQFYEVKLELGV